MSDHRSLRELAAALTAAAKRIDALVNEPNDRDGLTVPQRIKESYNGWPGGSGFDRHGRRSTDKLGEPLPNYSDPTGDAASRVDRAHNDERQILRHLRGAVPLVEQAVDAMDRYQLRDPNLIERQATEGEDAGCTSCRRIPGPRTRHWWNPPFRNGLCRFCSEFKRATNRLPTKEELEAHRDGKKVRRTA